MSRPRASHACRECRRKKMRCDLARPACTRCTSSSSACVYDGGSAGGRDIRFVQTNFYGGRGHVATEVGLHEATDEVTLSSTRLQTLEEKLEKLTAQVQALRSNSSSVAPSTLAPSEPLDETAHDFGKRPRTAASAASQDTSQESGAGHLLSEPGGHLRYVSRGHWAAMCEEAGEIEMLLKGQPASDFLDPQKRTYSPYYGRMSPSVPPWDKSNRLPTTTAQISSPVTLQIPKRSQADALFEAYVSCFHPIVPLTHIPTLRREYELFWNNQHSGATQDVIQITPLILAALYAGAVVYNHPSLRGSLPDIDLDHVTAELHIEALNALALARFPRVPSVSTLAAYLILHGTWMREDEPLNTTSTIGIAVRVAQMLGLHKDPSYFKTTVPPIQAEIHRRVWWHVFHCDVLVAVSSGLPPLIERNSWNTKMVSDLYEDKFGTLEGIHHDTASRAGYLENASRADISSLVSPMGIWLQAKFHETSLVRKLLDKAFHEEQMTINDMISVRNDLQQFRRHSRDCSRLIPLDASNNSYESNTQFNMWAKILLATFGDKNWWFLHTPLLHRSIAQAWQDLIPNLQLYCCAFLEQYIILCCAEDFIRFQWAWPGNHQPLHALMLVLKEVERNPLSAHAEISCAIVDQVMALCAPGGGISVGDTQIAMHGPLTDGGGEAWDLIRRLRARVWTKIGLDPDMAPTRDEVATMVAQKMQIFRATGGKLDLRTPLPIDEADEFDRHLASLAASNNQPGPSHQFARPLDGGGSSEQGQFDHFTFGLGGSGPTPNFNWEDWDQLFDTGGMQWR